VSEHLRGDAARPEWVASLDQGDLASAGRLYLQALRDASDPGRRLSEQRAATQTLAELVRRFPRVREFAGTATAESLGVVGDRSLRREWRDLREAEGHTTESARRARERGPSPGSWTLVRVMRRVALVGLFPAPQLLRLLWRWWRSRVATGDDLEEAPF
jgi:hypothetical protein